MRQNRLCWTMILVTVLTIFCSARPILAATTDEIIAMSDAGLPPDIIIEVIKATGLPDPLDIDTIIRLKMHNIDNKILEYLASNFAQSESESSQPDESTKNSTEEKRANFLGGEGFHSKKYAPLLPDLTNSYPMDPYRNLDYYPNPGSIAIYEPPVYFLVKRPYYRAYKAPRYYRLPPLYRSGPLIFVYDDFLLYYPLPKWFDNPCDTYWWTDDEWMFNWKGKWYRHHRYDDWDSTFDAWYHDDDFSISLHF